MPTATLTSKGQITLPLQVREELGLGVGDKIDFVAEERGVYRIVARRKDIRVLSGRFAGRVSRPITIEEMNQAILDEAAARHLAVAPKRKK